MANWTRWNRPSMLGLRRDIENIADEFDMPRSFRREISRLLSEDLSPRTMWDEMDQLLEEFTSPPTLRRRLSRLFENLPGPRGGLGFRGRQVFVPQVDLIERDDDYLLRVDVPGMREQDIDVHVDANNVLTVSGERREEETKRARGFEYTERVHGSFYRSVELPRGVDPSAIETTLKHGVLDVHIPKTEMARARRIPIGRRESGKEEPRVIAPGNGGATRSSEGRIEGEQR